MNTTPLEILALDDVTKTFGTTKAVDGVTLSVQAGELIGLIGHNGAGKSTTMRIMTGEHRPDAGSVRVGETVYPNGLDTRSALSHGIRQVHQELSLPANLSVAESALFFAPSVVGHGLGWRKRASRHVGEMLDAIFPSNTIASNRSIASLTIAERQMVAIAVAALTSSSTPQACLVLDEPTSALDVTAAMSLYAWLRNAAKTSGMSAVVSTHKLHEVVGELDRAYVMSDGRMVGEVQLAGATEDDLVRAMQRPVDVSIAVAEEEEAIDSAGSGSHSGSVHFQGYRDRVVEIEELTIGPGEIVGIGGLEGQGQKQFIERIIEAATRRRGSDLAVTGRIAVVSGDRATDGVFDDWDIERNLSIASIDELARSGLVSATRERELGARWKEALSIRGALGDRITSLSGGTQQKVLVGRALASGPDVLVLDDPTRGVDEATKLEIHAIVRRQAARGTAVVWHSTENAELRRCDRVVVMRAGRIQDTIECASVTPAEFEQRILSASF